MKRIEKREEQFVFMIAKSNHPLRLVEEIRRNAIS